MSPHYDPATGRSFYDQCYEQRQKLGSGSYAVVHEAMSRDDGEVYAIKRTAHPNVSAAERKRRIEELMVAKRIGEHPNLVHYYDAWEERGELFIRMELCAGGSLKTYALTHQISEDTLWSLFTDIILGLDHIHSQGYSHCDIKPANIFVVDGNSLKIGDFGIAVFHRDKTDHYSEGESGDPVYMAPEVLSKSDLFFCGPEVDIFSAGMTMLDLVSDLELPGNGDDWQALRRGALPPKLFEGVSNELADLIQQLLAPDYRRRPTAAQILRHPRIARITWRRKLWSFLVGPFVVVYSLVRLVLGLMLAVVASMTQFISCGMGRNAIAASPPAVRISEPYNVSTPQPEPIRTRLNFDDSAIGSDMDSASANRVLNRRLASPTAGLRNLTPLFSDPEDW